MTRRFHAQTGGSATAYAIDLNPRQAVRTLEQAIRHQAEVVLVPRAGADNEPIICRAESLEEVRLSNGRHRCLLVIPRAGRPAANDGEVAAQAADSRAERYAALITTYCDVTIRLGVYRYLFSSDVVGLKGPTKAGDEVGLYLARPMTLQVAQRRRFRRFLLRQSSPVQLYWINDDQSLGSGVAWLYNLGPNGLACRTEARVADQLWIGAQLKLEFSLTPNDPRRFALDASLCNKTAAGSRAKMILGLQFLTGPGHESSAQAAESLRQHLIVQYAVPSDAPEGADT